MAILAFIIPIIFAIFWREILGINTDESSSNSNRVYHEYDKDRDYYSVFDDDRDYG